MTSPSRRIRALSPIMGPGKSGKKLMLVVGEMDRISPATFGFALKLKHLPDFPLVMDADLNKNFEKVFLMHQESLGIHARFSLDRHRNLCHRR